MLSLARDLLKKTKDNQQVKALTTCFWSDFMSNPAIMYELFADTPRQLTYNPDKVKVMGTEAGMINWGDADDPVDPVRDSTPSWRCPQRPPDAHSPSIEAQP